MKVRTPMTVDFAHISSIFPKFIDKRTYIRGGGTYIVFASTFYYKVCGWEWVSDGYRLSFEVD